MTRRSSRCAGSATGPDRGPGRDHGASRATACRHAAEAVDVLSAQAPDRAEAPERAVAAGAPFVIPGGKTSGTGRLAETATSVKDEETGAWYSGKKHRPGTRTGNALLRGLRSQGERGFALLTRRRAALQRVIASPGRTTGIVRTALVLTQFEHKYIR